MTEASDNETGAPAPAAQPESQEPAPAPRPSLIARLAARMKSRGEATLREDLTEALAENAGQTGGFSPDERAMLNNILALREIRVEDVMVPRADIHAADITATLADILLMLEDTGHSRLPVYAETLDDPRGMIHIRDVMANIAKAARSGQRRGRGKPKAAAAAPSLDLAHVDLTKSIGELGIVRPVLFVPPSMQASDLMARMKAARIQMALVIDEYGGTDGLVSLEDIVEMVVGDISDEHDDDEAMVTKIGDGVFVVDARAEIDEVAEAIGGGFSAGEHEEDVDSIGGMIFNTLGRVPVRGEVVQAIPGFEFHVIEADPRRVKKVRIIRSRTAGARRKAPSKADPEEKPAQQ